MYDRYKVFHKATGGEGVLVVGQTGFSDSIVWAKNQAMLNQFMADFELPADAPTMRQRPEPMPTRRGRRAG